MNSIEFALIRRLRNFSNSINVELLSSGIINTLMPLNLLDAVIDGQINSQDAPSNLLRLNVPISSSLGNEGIDVICVLLRPSELEFDDPKLRKFRLLLRQNRNILLKMIKQQQYYLKVLFLMKLV